MPRITRTSQPLLAAQQYISQHLPELCGLPLQLHILDGPPDAPRYAVAIEACVASVCPHSFSAQADAGGRCGVRDCPLRRSVRLLLDHNCIVMQATSSGVHWN